MDTQTAETEIVEIEQYPFVKDIAPGSLSRAEMLDYWERNGVFEPWPQHEDSGPGKKYADSTEYVQAMRARADYRGH